MTTVGLLGGQVALVTGASRGIGAATARALVAAGATVVLAAREEHALTTVASQLEATGGRAVGIVADVTDQQSMERLVETIVGRFGSLDVAVNNAAGGGHRPTPLAEVAVEDFDSALSVNLRGVFLSMRAEIPAMLAVGGGSIVNMASTAGVEAVGGMAGYVASKFGVLGLTRTAALDYAERGIRVNALAPGPILTDHLSRAGAPTRELVAGTLPIRRLGAPEEVAAAAVWLCSRESSFVTGATIVVDGGKLAGSAPFRRSA